jgi:peptide/nickel transport system permease protein
MVGLLIGRLFQAALVMLVISALVFAGVYAVGNPIDVLIGPDVTQEIRQQTIERYGLDQPLWLQYLAFLKRLMVGDLGTSFVFNMPVLDLILSRLPATLEIALLAVLAATLIGVPVGMLAGWRPHHPLSRLAMGVSVLGFSVPTFWIGLVLILVFAVWLGWLPAGGRGPTVAWLDIEWSVLTAEGWKHLLLPTVNLALFKMAMMMRLARASTRELMLSDTVRLARATGQSEATIMQRHVLRLISIPIVTVFGLELGATLAFAVVTETIFSWPGAGKLIIDSIQALDRPVMVGYLMLVALLFTTINLVVDLVYALLDPRLRSRRS